MSDTQGSPKSIEEQATYLAAFAGRMLGFNGVVAKETWVLVTDEDHAQFAEISTRMKRMAPHEGAIRKLVIGK
jgi:hypothetical protein